MPLTSDDDPVLEMPVPLPPDGNGLWYFPGARDHGHADVVARVFRRDRTSWIACLAEDERGYHTHPAAFVMPCGARVFLSGGIADRDDPASWRPLHTARPARSIWSADRRVVVFSDGMSLDVHGPAGPLWHACDVGELSVLAVTAEKVSCSIYDPVTGADVERAFDTATGRALPV